MTVLSEVMIHCWTLLSQFPDHVYIPLVLQQCDIVAKTHTVNDMTLYE